MPTNPAAAGFLQRITDDRRRRIEELKQRVPVWELRARLPATRPAGRLERALRAGLPPSPSGCCARSSAPRPRRECSSPTSTRSPWRASYQEGGAAAISVVTEPDHFQGDVGLDGCPAAGREPAAPLKDFVIDSYQIVDAAVRGADGVLLLASVLSDVQLQRLITEARLLGLDCLVEVHDADELTTSLRAGATLLGLNNRDLRTFEVDPETAFRLLPRVPPLVTAVAESGLSDPKDLARLRGTRCDAVLMGEVFMTSPDPARTLATLSAAARG